MRYGSAFTGVGGFDAGFDDAGWECAWQIEKEPFCKAVLASRWPKVKRFDDIVDCCGVDCLDPGRWVQGDAPCERKHHLTPVDCITAGVPCQDVSVAGQRRGLGGNRTVLVYEFARILQELRPPWFVFENVPGLFSSNEGRDFAEILRLFMVDCGYGVCWRVLDSRYFNVAQRRERVFLVGCLGKPCPTEILFEPEGSGRNFAESGAARSDIAVPLTSSASDSKPGRRLSDDFNIVAGPLQTGFSERGHGKAGVNDQAAASGHIVASAIISRIHKGGFTDPVSDNIIAIQDVRGGTRDKTDQGQGIGLDFSGGPMYTLSKTEQHAIAFDTTQLTSRENRSNPQPGEPCHPLAAGAHAPAVVFESRFVRNGRGAPSGIVPPLKAQSGSSGKGDGAPLIAGPYGEDLARSLSRVGGGDDFGANKGTLIGQETHADRVREFAGLPKGMDSPRYRALGNAVTKTVARWIAERLRQYCEENLPHHRRGGAMGTN